jgi:nucleotide-binding universal stress UspA family protein
MADISVTGSGLSFSCHGRRLPTLIWRKAWFAIAALYVREDFCGPHWRVIMIKDIVVSLSVPPARDVAGKFAVSVAAALGAHVTGIAFLYDPFPAFTTIGRLPEDVLEQLRTDAEAATKESVASFEQAAGLAGVPFTSRIVETGFIGAANFFGSVARTYDLAIVRQAEPDRASPEELILEAALFDSGRPALVVPYITQRGLELDRVMVCWDGGRAAARAVGDAIPLLERAKSVEILIIEGEPRKEDSIPGAEVARFLARHDLNVKIRQLPRGELDVADAILSQAADGSADLLVMGGYGHSRLREFILGGVTRDILNTMTIPVLMSH